MKRANSERCSQNKEPNKCNRRQRPHRPARRPHGYGSYVRDVGVAGSNSVTPGTSEGKPLEQIQAEREGACVTLTALRLPAAMPPGSS
jgi:hypothetical protein